MATTKKTKVQIAAFDRSVTVTATQVLGFACVHKAGKGWTVTDPTSGMRFAWPLSRGMAMGLAVALSRVPGLQAMMASGSHGKVPQSFYRTPAWKRAGKLSKSAVESAYAALTAAVASDPRTVAGWHGIADAIEASVDRFSALPADQNPVVAHVLPEVLRAAVSRRIYCGCNRILDVRSAVYVETKDGCGVSCGNCYDATPNAASFEASPDTLVIDGRRLAQQV